MSIKLFDSELKVMDVLWKHGDLTAKEISNILNEEINWNVNTTYTVIKKCIKKEAVQRLEPNFICHALISREAVQESETKELLDRMFDGSKQKLFASLLGSKDLSKEKIAKLREFINENE